MKNKLLKLIVNISSFLLSMLSGLAGLFIFFLAVMPLLLFKLGPQPNRLIIIFLVLPLAAAALSIFYLLGVAISMILWKFLLDKEEIKEYFFEPLPKDWEVSRLHSFLFVKPYYKIALFIFPELKKEFKNLI